MSVDLERIRPCFEGIVPAIVATCARDGEPNVIYVSQLYFVDSNRVALSCQFFNKTRRNIDENPHASVIVNHPVTFEAYRFDHLEKEGPLFATMAARIDMIASHTGMTGIFRLLSADVYEVLSVERLEGFLLPDDAPSAASAPPLPAGPLTEIRGLQTVCERVARAHDLEHLLGGTLAALDELFGFSHSMVLVPSDSPTSLVAIASRGYGDRGMGAEVPFGCGIIGTVAQRRARAHGARDRLRTASAIKGRARAAARAVVRGCAPAVST